MNNSISRKYNYILFVCILFAGIQAVFANQTFDNNLLKADVSKNSFGGVKVTLYTSKPYKDTVVTNKKNDYEYVILMPETANSLTTKPSFGSASDVVKNIEVKTQQYSGNVKGYTKITVSTTRPIEVIPQVQTLNTSSYALSEKEYKELLAQTSKKQTKIVKKELKPVVVVKKEAASSKISKLPKEQIKKQKSFEIAKNSRRNKYEAVEQRRIRTSKAIQPRIRKNEKTKTVTEPKIHHLKKITSEKNAVQTPKISVSEPISKKVKAPVSVAENQQANVVNPGIAPQVQQSAPKTEKAVAEQPKPIVVNSKLNSIKKILISYVPGLNETRFEKIKTITKNNLYTLLALLSIGFIMLLLVARKMTKSMRGQKQDFVNNLESKPFVPTDLTDKITDDMTWKEKFQTYVDVTGETNKDDEVEIKPVQANQELDELFSSDTTETTKEDVLPESGFVTEINSNDLNEADFTNGIEDIDQSLFEEQIKEQPVEDRIESDSFLSELDNMVGGNYDIQDDVSVEDVFGEDEEPSAYDDVEDIFEDEFIIEESETPFLNTENTTFTYDVEEEQLFEEELDTSANEEEIVKSEFIIGDGKGFYLVDFEDTTALVGQINDEIFVLKKFETKIDDKLQARLNEQKGNAVNYMTRVGDFKALVEVTPSKMNLLIEL